MPVTGSPKEEGRALHARLLSRDPTAERDVAFTYMDRITDWLIARNPQVHPHECSTAAEVAILSYLKRPEIYDPEQQTLEVFLRISAADDLKNLLKSERRHSESRADSELVELPRVVEKHARDEEADPAHILAEKEEAEARLRSLVPPWLAVGLTDGEIRVLALMHVGERSTRAYAVALGLLHLPFKEQQKDVKRVKDRLKKRMERMEP